jgi:hypothetical protein
VLLAIFRSIILFVHGRWETAKASRLYGHLFLQFAFDRWSRRWQYRREREKSERTDEQMKKVKKVKKAKSTRNDLQKRREEGIIAIEIVASLAR